MWKIYYTDGSEFTSDEGNPWEAPRQHVQVIVQTDPDVGYELVDQKDYFYYEHERWWSADFMSAMRHLFQCKGHPLVLQGEMILTRDFMALRQKIFSEWGEKQGWLPRERQDVG